MAIDKDYEELYDKSFETDIDELRKEIEANNSEEYDDEGEEKIEEVEQQDDETEELDTDEAKSDKKEDETDDSTTEKKGRTIKWKGQDIFVSDDEIDTFIQKGFDYTKKTQDLAKYRPLIELIDENNLTHEDLMTLNAARNGNKDALGKIIGAANVDVYDIDTTATYKPDVAVKNYELQDVIETIKSDSTHSQKMDQYISSVSETTRNLFVSNPAVLKGLYEDEKSGVAQKIMPELVKAMFINPNADFIQTYRSIGEKIFATETAQAPATEIKQETKQEASRETKKKATISKKGNASINDHKDIWEDDELFAKMLKMTNVRL